MVAKIEGVSTMFAIRHSTGSRITIIAVGAAVVALALAGCGTTDDSSAKPTKKPSHSSSASPSASASSGAAAPASPAPSASAVAGATAVSVACGTLVSAQTMYDFNPNFTLKTTFNPASGSAAAQAIANKGVACGWVNGTSNDTVVVSAAKPAAATLASLKTSAAAGTAASGLGDAAYFSTSGGVGRVDAFKGGYWVTASSDYFGATADAQSIVASALAALK
ncbi:hypothetical protein BH09ACT1_BH09ACT1_11480 [soil metagenome]